MSSVVWADFTTQLRALEQARVVDFVRFVGRRLEEEPERNTDPFRVTWARLVSEYADLAGLVGGRDEGLIRVADDEADDE